MPTFIRPIAGNPKLNWNYQAHLANGSVNPGQDYGVPVGTPVLAPANGVVKVDDDGTSGAAGISVVIYFDNGWSCDLLHLSRNVVTSGQRVTQGQIVGYSGNTGKSTGPHLHFSLRNQQINWYGNAGNVNPEDFLGEATLAPTQRQVKPTGPEVLRRAEPTSKSADLEPDLQPGEVGNFDGWIHGELVNGNSVWFRGISGNWFWSGGFTDTGTHDLTDLNPKAPANTRINRNLPANVRSQPTTKSTVLATLEPNVQVTVIHWVEGETVTQNGVTSNAWFKIPQGLVSAVCFTDSSTNGISKGEVITPPPSPDPDPVPPAANVLDPSKYKDKIPDSPLAKWIGSPNFGKRDPKPKDHISHHWMAGRLPGTDQTFQLVGEITAEGLGLNAATTYGIGYETGGQLAVHQYIAEDEYHHGDGDAESNASGISIEHEGGWVQADGTRAPVSDDVVERSIQLHVDIALRRKWTSLIWMVNVFPHKHYTETMCPGTLPSQFIVDEANKRLQAVLEPGSPVEPNPSQYLTKAEFEAFRAELAAVIGGK